MTDYTDLAARLSAALNLATPPVAVTFLAEKPADIAGPADTVAAGCRFWQLGAHAALATDASDHRLCSIGIHTHNLADAPPTQQADLVATLTAMQGLDYVRPDEVGALPVMPRENRCVTYMPLAQTSEVPAVVLLFAHADQGLIITEALSRVDGDVPATLGRPACALIPQVVNGARSASSLGCCGARAYLDVFDDSTTLWALHGAKLAEYVEAIETFANANDTLTKFHQLRRDDVAAGKTPSVEESLGRLQ